MGQLEMFAQRTFAEETERITGGAAQWQEPAEIRLEKVTSDGFLAVRRPDALAKLAAPWSLARAFAEVMLELKLAGNHLDRLEVEKALLRRQARQVQRVDLDPAWRGEEPLWLVASHLPAWLSEMYCLTTLAPGCYWVSAQWQSFLWVAANELPLDEALIPFLLARSGQALDEFARWVAPRRPFGWVLTMLEFMPMSTLAREDLLWRFGKSDDPEIEARRQHILRVLLEVNPQDKQVLVQEAVAQAAAQAHEQGLEQGRLTEARASLRRVLARRQLMPTHDEDARIEACADLETLRRWQDQAVTAANVPEALA
jgi:hypothetical protein